MVHAAVLTLIGCNSFPELKPHLILTESGLCGRFQQIDNDPIQFTPEPVEWFSIDHCSGFIALPPENIGQIRSWYDTNYGDKKNHPKILIPKSFYKARMR